VSAPLTRNIEENVAALALGASDDTTLTQAPFAGTVTGVKYIADAAITGANTNTRSVSLINKGQAGAGNVVVATLQFNAGVNAPAQDDVSLTLGVAANLVLAEGDNLVWRSTSVGTGIADPGGLVQVSVSRSTS
jgi:hypothetical protein